MFSAGNGGPFNGSCSFAEYVNSIYTIGISVVTGSNAPSRQNNKCSAISAVTYSRDNTMGLGFEGDLMVSGAVCDTAFHLGNCSPYHSFESAIVLSK